MSHGPYMTAELPVKCWGTHHIFGTGEGRPMLQRVLPRANSRGLLWSQYENAHYGHPT